MGFGVGMRPLAGGAWPFRVTVAGSGKESEVHETLRRETSRPSLAEKVYVRYESYDNNIRLTSFLLRH
jgi:hypothetical protein